VTSVETVEKCQVASVVSLTKLRAPIQGATHPGWTGPLRRIAGMLPYISIAVGAVLIVVAFQPPSRDDEGLANRTASRSERVRVHAPVVLGNVPAGDLSRQHDVHEQGVRDPALHNAAGFQVIEVTTGEEAMAPLPGP
jgi:hypothetical protein